MKKTFFISLIILIVSCVSISKNSKSKIEESWMGIFIKQERIGYSFSQIAKIKDSYKLSNRVKIDLTMMGQTEKVISNFAGITDTNYVLRSFEFSFKSQNRSFSAQGLIKDKNLMIEVNSGGTIKKESREISRYVYPVMTIGNVAMKLKFQPLKEYLIKVFDATVLSVVDAKIKMFGKEAVIIDGKNHNLNKMTVAMLGVTTTMWVTDNGTVKKEEAPPGMTMIEQSRDKALVQEETYGKLDILSLFSVPADTIIPFPRKTTYLKARILNVNYNEFNLNDDFQQITMTNPLTLEIKSLDSLPNVKLPIQGADEYLKPSLYIQSNDSQINKLAKKIIGNETNAIEIVKKINLWVFNNVRKTATASLPSAVDVLQNLEGDCNEHAILFAALCRAAGVPCQICVGLVYVDEYFYYHAWDKVYLGKWIAVDPTFGQFPVDATHIKFAEGELEHQAKIIQIVGQIKIKIYSFK